MQFSVVIILCVHYNHKYANAINWIGNWHQIEYEQYGSFNLRVKRLQD